MPFNKCLNKWVPLPETKSPVLLSAYKILQDNEYVFILPEALTPSATELIPILKDYTRSSWLTHSLHLLPYELGSDTKIKRPGFTQKQKDTLNWIWLVSSLNFSFWTEQSEAQRWGVDWWKDGWNHDKEGDGEIKKWTGYWGLLAGINKELEGTATDLSSLLEPSQAATADLEKIFAPSASSVEPMPLLSHRHAILQRNAAVFESLPPHQRTWADLIESWEGTAGELLQFVVDTFPDGFGNDNGSWQGHTVYFWKRAQILIAETWAAFYPQEEGLAHPVFPSGVSELTMFPDYRVPQILHTLGILSYSPHLTSLLQSKTLLPHTSEEEMSIRAGSLVAVEELRIELIRLTGKKEADLPAVLLDFALWDTAKEWEGKGKTMLDCHRTRSQWY